MHACEMTLTYLGDGLYICSVVWVPFEYFFLQFIKMLMQLCKDFFYNLENYHSYLFFLEPFTLEQLFLWSPLLLHLPANLDYSLKRTNSNVVSSIFSGLTS